MTINPETLTHVLSKMLGKPIRRADYHTQELQGGTLGDVYLVTGMAEDAAGAQLPYQVVWKTQMQWERPGDSPSWRREYDLYMSDFDAVCTHAFRWPVCYHGELGDTEMELWMEYVQGPSGSDLTIDMLEQAAMAIGRFQGRLHKQPPAALQQNTALGDVGFMAREFAQWHTQSFTYEFLISPESRWPDFLKRMLKNGDICFYEGKSIEYGCLRSPACDLPAHLQRMLTDIDDRWEAIFEALQRLPTVLCHRDYWIENIFIADNNVVAIDWDGAGWGFLGEDIASLIVDDTDAAHLGAYYRKLIPAYHKGLSEYMDISGIGDFHVRDMMLVKFGYRILQHYMFTQSAEIKQQQIEILQAIHELADGG